MFERSAIISPAVNGSVVIYDERSDEQDIEEISTLAFHLSVECKTSVLAVMNHDDDVLWYRLFKEGQLVDEYNSCPGYFSDEDGLDSPSGGNAAVLANAFDSQSPDKIEKILRATNEEYTFAIERHEALASALGLPPFVVGGGYRYISDGELPDGLSSENLVRTS